MKREGEKMITKRNIVKAFVVLIAALLLIVIYSKTKKETLHFVPVVNSVPELSQKEIITSGHETIIQSFKTIEDVKWLDSQQLLIKGSLETRSGYYVFNLEKQLLMPYKENMDKISDLKSLTYEIKNGKILTVNNSTIEIQEDNSQKVIAKDIHYKDEDLYQISEDGSKVLYYNALDKTLVTYDFNKNAYKIILKNVPEIILNNFFEKVKLSPLGGYISIEYFSDELEENYFSIYGADSGKLYGEEIHGIDVTWSKDDLYLAFFYTKESEKISESSNKIISKRLGYYDVENKAIKYLDSTPLEKEMVSKLKWQGHKTAVLVGHVLDTLNVTGLLINDFKDLNFYEIPMEINGLSPNALINLLWQNQYLWVFINQEDNQDIYKVDTVSGHISLYKDLKPFSLIDLEAVNYYYKDGKLITFQDNKVTLADVDKERIAHVDDVSFKVIPHPDMNGFALWLDEEMVIKIVDND